MSNQETQQSDSQSFSLEINSSMPENSTKVKLELNKKMQCSIAFMANSFNAIMKQDDDIRTAILIAVAEVVASSEGVQTYADDLLNELLNHN